MKKTLLLLLFTLTTLAGHADEGMWMLTDLKEQNAATMYDMGLDISIDKVYCPDSISLKDAVVHFGVAHRRADGRGQQIRCLP